MRVLFALTTIACCLAACSTYVEKPSGDDVQKVDLPKTRTFEEGRKYIRAVDESFAAKIRDLIRQERASQGGIIGGALTVFGGLIARAQSEVALGGAAAGAASYTYGQAFGAREIRKVYMDGERALQCLDERANTAYRPLRAWGELLYSVGERLEELDNAIDGIRNEARKGNDTAQKAAERFLSGYITQAEAVRAWLAVARPSEADLAAAMYNEANGILADVNRLAEGREATLESINHASQIFLAATAVPSAPDKGKSPPENDDKSLIKSYSELDSQKDIQRSAATLDSASKRLTSALELAEQNAQQPQYVELNAASCRVWSVEEATLTFMPTKMVFDKKGGTLPLMVSGGRVPYTWAPYDQLPSGLTVNSTGSGATSGTFTIVAPEGLTPRTIRLAFSSLHPKANPQVYEIEIVDELKKN